MSSARRFLPSSPRRIVRLVVAAAFAVASTARCRRRPHRLRGGQPDQRVPGDRHRVRGRESRHQGAVQLRRLRARCCSRSRKGAPVDVFASADQETMDQAEQQKLVRPGTRANFVSNSLVVDRAARRGTRRRRRSPISHAPAVRQVAIGVPASVPVGRYTKAVLEKARPLAADRGEDDRRAVGAPGARLRRARRGRRRLRLRAPMRR